MIDIDALEKAAKFWEKVDKRGPDDCWPWTAYISKKGYGESTWGRAHRVAYTIASGPIPKNKFVCHSCDNRPCCNPRHLHIGGAKSNAMEAVERNRYAFGSRAATAKLNDGDVRRIRALYSPRVATFDRIGKMFGVSPSAIVDIIKGRTWKRVV